MLEGNLGTDNYNDYTIGPLPVDIFPALTLGVSYRLPEPGKKAPAIAPAAVEPPTVVAPVEETKPAVVEPPKVVAPVEAKVVEPIAPVESKPAVVEPPKVIAPVETKVAEPVKVVEPVEAKVVAPVEAKPVIIPTGELNDHIFFTLNQRTIGNVTQEETIQQIVAYLNANPTANIIVSGFADQSTGSIDANNQISKERAVNVANKLIREHNINIKRIFVKWYGGGIQPYLKASKNRLVIVRTPKAKLTLAEPEPVKMTTKPAESNPIAAGTDQSTDPTAAATNEGGLFLTVNFAETHAEISEKSQEAIIIKVASYLRRHPDAKIAVSGYADKSNGSADKNNILSKERAVNVANVLIQRYSIASERIHVKWFGATKQTYTKPSMSRLVLIETISM
jgi:outer membrane protein OmpA-like peptidoglycan-associated protein